MLSLIFALLLAAPQTQDAAASGATARGGQRGAGAQAGAQTPTGGRGAGAQTATGRGRGTAAPTPAAPPPGSPAIYKSVDEFLAGLKTAAARAAAGAMYSSNFATTDQYQINMVHRDVGATPLTHAGNTELHYIVEGSATVVTGGKIIRPAAGTTGTANVEGGVERKISKGDVILVPADTVHWYKDVAAGGVTYLEVRFVVPTK